MNKKTNEFKEALEDIRCSIEKLEGTKMLLEDVLEDFTSASMSVNADEKNRDARLKMMTLLSLMENELKDMNKNYNNLEEDNYENSK